LGDLASKVHAGTLRLDEAVAAHPFRELPPDAARDAFDRAIRHLRWEATGAIEDTITGHPQ
jgi:hypothetical protein